MQKIIRTLSFATIAILVVIGLLLVQSARKYKRHKGANTAQALVWELPSAGHEMPPEWADGSARFRDGDFAGAARIFADAAARHPGEVLFLQAAAEAFSGSGQADSAVDYLLRSEAMTEFPASLSGIRRRILLEGGFALAGGDAAQKALEYARMVLKDAPDDSDGMLLEGYAESRLGHATAAEDILGKAIEAHPGLVQGYSPLIQLCLQRGDAEAARHWLGLLEKTDPQASGLDALREMISSGNATNGTAGAQSERLRISCPSGCPSGAERKVLDEAEQAWTFLRGELGLAPARPIGVLITPSGTTGRPGIPGWAAALFDGQVRVSQDRLADGLQPILRHELAHAFLAEASQSRVPLWYTEGMAQRMEGKTLESLPDAAHMEWLDSLPRRDRFTDLDEARARIAYSYSLRLATELWLLNGGNGMRGYLSGLASGKSDSVAFRDAFGNDYSALSARIRAAL
ncbi:MAG: hypothetical protein RL318_568 [Fibrobacterota bacterium]